MTFFAQIASRAARNSFAGRMFVTSGVD